MSTPFVAVAGSSIDYVIIVAYFVFVLGFGSFFGRFSRSTRDFFFSGQRFAWWLIAMSMVATGVGSYSFLKYSAKAFEYGMSSSMTYMNDWFMVPLFMFGWLPIIYFSRIRSIPEYFERRFDTRGRIMAVIILILYMVGYIGINLYTLGVAAEAVLGVSKYNAMVAIAAVSAVYIGIGGQTAVIFTDLLQGFMLLFAGLLLFVLGLDYLGMDAGIVDGFRNLWAHITWHGPGGYEHIRGRLPFAKFNEPHEFNFVGIFWQDGIAGSITFLFINQGLMMRFLAAKSMTEGRKTIFMNTLFLLPISMVVVSNAGWIGNAMSNLGILDPNLEPDKAFVAVTDLVCQPGVFGFVLAALTAALMSTIDTLTNATAAVFVYDVYQPYLARKRSDRHYLRVARLSSFVTSALGLGCGFFFSNFSSIYEAHGSFIAAVTPPIVVSVLLGAFWKRYTPAAAFWSMFGGAFVIGCSSYYPDMIAPFATWLHGVSPDGGYKYMRAFFGLIASGAIGVIISLFTKPKDEAAIAGLWVGSIDHARRMFKGAEPSFEVGRKISAELKITDEAHQGTETLPTHVYNTDTDGTGPAADEYAIVRLGPADMEALKVAPGDLIYIADRRWYLGGLRSLHARVGQPHDQGNVVYITEDDFKTGCFLPRYGVRVEKLL